MSVILDQQDELQNYYHHELQLEVSDTGYSRGLYLGPPVGKIIKTYCMYFMAGKTKSINPNRLKLYT
jgi:hypothetical protein